MLIERDPMEILNLLKEPSKNKHGRPLNRFPSHSGFSIWNKPAKTIFRKIPRLIHPPISLMFRNVHLYQMFPIMFPWFPHDFPMISRWFPPRRGDPVHQQKRHARDQAHRGDALGREIMTDRYIYMVYFYRNHEINRFPHGQHPCIYLLCYIYIWPSKI